MRRLAETLAVPRAVGSAALAEAVDLVARELEALGLVVQRQAFRVTPRRLAAVSVLGAGLGWTALGSVPLLVLDLPRWAPMLGAGALALVGLLAHGVSVGRVPGGGTSIEATNLIATRGTARAWVVAHLDSKSQAFSLLTRVVAVALSVAGVLGLVTLYLARIAGPVPWPAVAAAVLCAAIGGGVLSRSAPGNRSPGAVDNASGVLALLVAAEALQARDGVGILVTSAEELGMEGARRWAANGGDRGVFINFDGIDGRGRFRLLRHGKDGERVAARMRDQLWARGWHATTGSLPPGVLVDGAVLHSAGLAGITVSRGNVRTLADVHTPRDNVARLDEAAIEAAGRAAAAVLIGLSTS